MADRKEYRHHFSLDRIETCKSALKKFVGIVLALFIVLLFINFSTLLPVGLEIPNGKDETQEYFIIERGKFLPKTNDLVKTTGGSRHSNQNYNMKASNSSYHSTD